MQIIIALQRASASMFTEGARDNFNYVIGLGNLSKESQQMLFSEHRENMKPDRKQGTGYLLVSGSELIPVAVPTIRRMEKLHRVIREGTTR
jgi:hypothetical protein